MGYVGLFTLVDKLDKYILIFMTKALSCQIYRENKYSVEAMDTSAWPYDIKK